MTTLTVKVAKDTSASVWSVQQSELQGLKAEATSLDELIQQIVHKTPTALATHPIQFEGQDIRLRVVADVIIRNPLLGG
jgi:hypothetical protein